MNLILLAFALIGLTTLIALPLISFIKYLLVSKIVKNPVYNQPVSIILTCFNEEKFIKKRIDYFLDKDEWIDGSEIIVISTGSTDHTDAILNNYKRDGRVKIILLESRLSKIKTLNRFVSDCKNEIIVFSDCRQTIAKKAVKNMVRHFSDSTINVVSSTLEDTKNKKKVSFFRSVLNRMAIWESKSGSSLNVFGALYAQRKTAFQPFPEDLLFDDLFVVVSTLKQNKRLIQDKDAVIKDVDFEIYYQKERIERLVRGLLIFLHKEKKGIFSLKKMDLIRFLIYKYLKLIMPFFLLIILFEIIYFYSTNELLYSIIGLLFSLLLLIPAFRKTISQFIKINYYFFISIFKFYLKKERSNSWKPLNFKETNQPS